MRHSLRILESRLDFDVDRLLTCPIILQDEDIPLGRQRRRNRVEVFANHQVGRRALFIRRQNTA
jgi:hypothetical protein